MATMRALTELERGMVDTMYLPSLSWASTSATRSLYSARNALAGSTAVARRAGRYVAPAAMTSSSAATLASVAGSLDVTPNSIDESSFDPAIAPASPITVPAPATTNAWRITMLRMLPVD